MGHTQKLSPDRLRRLVAALGDTANVSEAARRISISRWLAYSWYNRSKKGEDVELFVVEIAEDEYLPLHEAWDAALEVATDFLELTARRLATGYQEPLVHQGEITMQHDPILDCMVPVTITKYDSRMLEILLKARRPDVYRERHDHRHNVEVGGVLLVKTIPETKAEKANWEEGLADQQEEARGRGREDDD